MISEDEVKRVYASAPQNLKDYIDSDVAFNAFHGIRKAHNLHLDHAGNLALAINAVILGVKPFEELPALLKEGLQGVDDATRAKVAQDVNDKIFVPLRELTKKRAEAVSEQASPKPTTGIRAIERSVSAQPAPVIRPNPATTSSGVPTVSVVEQKMPGMVQSSESGVASNAAPGPATAKPTAPPAPPKYHGTDPYREAPE